ncbi:MAG: ATP-binding protein [Breznakibacter sp.]|nr:ATP-binding protein [Chitinophagales bacterium]
MHNTLETLIIQSEVANISLVERLIDDISAKYQLHDDVYGKILLAVVEGVNNAIVHGNKLDSLKLVSIQYIVNEEFIEFIILDEGPGFDLSTIPDPTKPENLEKTHGRGVFLMNHLADEIQFLDGGNKVSMKFNLL